MTTTPTAPGISLSVRAHAYTIEAARRILRGVRLMDTTADTIITFYGWADDKNGDTCFAATGLPVVALGRTHFQLIADGKEIRVRADDPARCHFVIVAVR